MFQTDGGEDGKTVNDSSKALAENQVLKVGADGFPFVVIGIRKPRQRQDVW